MATRVEVQKKKTALIEDLRSAFFAGEWRAGEVAVSQRELSHRYDLSMRTVGLELQKLVEEGILYAVPRVGTFVGRPVQPNPSCFLFVRPYNGPEENHIHLLRTGFEDRIASLGGASFSLTPQDYRDQSSRGVLPPLAGIFQRTFIQPGDECPVANSTPCVRFGKVHDVAKSGTDLPEMDIVDFDNVTGGAQAARHLLEMGYRRIALVGLHDASTKPGSTAIMHWSAERAQGWRDSLMAAGVNPEGLLFLPAVSAQTDHASQIAAAKEAVSSLMSGPPVDAIISANMFVGDALLKALQSQGGPDSAWPALVSFDDYHPTDSHVLSCFHLPWASVGAAAADLLWERSHGTLTGPSQVRTVPFRLVRRLSCRQDWAQGVITARPSLAAA